MQYPEHIYDPARREIAHQLLTKEYSKLFPDVDPERIASDVQGWFDNPSKYHLESSPQDFWDIFDSQLDKVKRKPGFTEALTAANYTWRKQEVPVRSIRMTSKLEQLNRIPGLEWHGAITVGEVFDAAEIADVVAVQREDNDSFSSEAQDAYPIIIRNRPNKPLSLMDGNRRSLRAALYGRTTISAWVGTLEDEEPKDFWEPTGNLFRLVDDFRRAKTDPEKQAIRDVLEQRFSASVIARLNYENRVITYGGATELLAIPPRV